MRARVGHFVRCSLVAAVAATSLAATPAHADPTCAPPEYIVIDGWTVQICADPDSGQVWAYVLHEGAHVLSVDIAVESLEEFSVVGNVESRRIRAQVDRSTSPDTGEDTLTLCLWIVVTPPQDPVGACRSRVLP